MAEISITRYELLSGVLPGPVSLVLSDNIDPDKATTGITIRMKSDAPYGRAVVLSQKAVLVWARDLIGAQIALLDGIHHSEQG